MRKFKEMKIGEDVTFVVDSHKSYFSINKDLNVELKFVTFSVFHPDMSPIVVNS